MVDYFYMVTLHPVNTINTLKIFCGFLYLVRKSAISRCFKYINSPYGATMVQLVPSQTQHGQTLNQLKHNFTSGSYRIWNNLKLFCTFKIYRFEHLFMSCMLSKEINNIHGLISHHHKFLAVNLKKKKTLNGWRPDFAMLRFGGYGKILCTRIANPISSLIVIC